MPRGAAISEEEARRIVLLHDRERKTFKEIAKILNRSVSGVEKAYHRYKQSDSQDRGALESKVIKCFQDGLTPTETAVKLKVPLKTVKEIWDIYTEVEQSCVIQKTISKEELSDIYIPELDLTVQEILKKFWETYKEYAGSVNEILDRLDAADKSIADLEETLQSFRELESVAEELDKFKAEFKDFSVKLDSLNENIKEFSRRLSAIEDYVNKLKEYEKEKKSLVKRLF